MRSFVVIPCRNEQDNIGDLVRKVGESYVGAEVVVVDDNSSDETGHVASDAGARVIQPGYRRGLSDVYRAGLLHALKLAGPEQALFVEMDAGGSHDPCQLPRFFSTLGAGLADVAAGRRFGSGAKHTGSFKRAALSWCGTRMVNALHGTYFKDATSGYVGYTKEALELLLEQPYESRGHFYQTEVRLRARRLGLRVVEVPITYRASSSSLNMASINEALDLVTR